MDLKTLQCRFPAVKFTKSIVFFNRLPAAELEVLQQCIRGCNRAIARRSVSLKEGDLYTVEIYLSKRLVMG